MKLELNRWSTVYISGACNSTSRAVDWGPNGICTAIENCVAILNTDVTGGFPGKYEKTLFAHKDRVNAVKWIRGFGILKNAIVSSSVDKTAIVWIDKKGTYVPNYILKGHEDSITDVCAISLQLETNTSLLIATMSLNEVIIWKKSDSDEDFCLLQTLKYAEVDIGATGLSFSLLPDNQALILACPRNFIDISLYTCPLTLTNESSKAHLFKHQQTLPGHTNWINDLAFTTESKTLLLASASHDATIRVWRIFEKNSDSDGLDLREYAFSIGEKHFTIVIYSILHGHDQWIYKLHWKHSVKENDDEQDLKLLSVSADKSIIIWKKDLSADTFVENYRLGDIGGNVSGFLGGCFSPDGLIAMAHDLVGAFHVWKYNKFHDSWSHAMLPSGHFDDVNDLQWDPEGRFLVSVSNDKTTRLHAPSIKDSSYWYEFARPQTHGHIISSLTVLPNFRFISGAAEKELRSFIAPKTFIRHFITASRYVEVNENNYSHNNAILPSLDLSNKPANEVDVRNIEKFDSTQLNEVEVHEIPTEDELARNTLWPEIQKLYFHPNEISCIASTRDGCLIASACKANSPKESLVVIWSVETWDDIRKIQEIGCHQLTVTQLAFSSCSLYLISVSRDRTWNLFARKKSSSVFELIAHTSKTNGIHKRQLNCCAWSHDSKYFSSGSRDGRLVIWSEDEESKGDSSVSENLNDSLNGFCSRHILSLQDENILSVSFAPVFIKQSCYLFAIGFGTGKIGLYEWNTIELQSHCWLILGGDITHNGSITRIVFRPVNKNSDQHLLELASCGVDRLVKIHRLNLNVS